MVHLVKHLAGLERSTAELARLERWRVVTAAVGLVSLTVVVAWQLTRPVATPAPIQPLATDTPPAAVAEGVDEPPTTDVAAVMTAAQEAVHAWGRFATTGDLSLLESHFDPAGPQYRQLVTEATGRASDPARYRLTLANPDVKADTGGWLVRGDVQMTRDSRAAGQWRWQLQLRHHDEHSWRVWTVTLANDNPS